MKDRRAVTRQWYSVPAERALPLFTAAMTAYYTFRMFFLVFHGKERMDEHTREHLHESPTVVTMPLVLLAIPSIIVGAIAIGPLQFDAPRPRRRRECAPAGSASASCSEGEAALSRR